MTVLYQYEHIIKNSILILSPSLVTLICLFHNNGSFCFIFRIIPMKPTKAWLQATSLNVKYVTCVFLIYVIPIRF